VFENNCVVHSVFVVELTRVQAKTLIGLRTTLAKHAELAETFGFGEATTEARERLKLVEEELSMAKDVWDTLALCEQQFAVWKKTLWNDINTEAMEDASKAFVKEVHSSSY
jgi:hypothetical protein